LDAADHLAEALEVPEPVLGVRGAELSAVLVDECLEDAIDVGADGRAVGGAIVSLRPGSADPLQIDSRRQRLAVSGRRDRTLDAFAVEDQLELRKALSLWHLEGQLRSHQLAVANFIL